MNIFKITWSWKDSVETQVAYVQCDDIGRASIAWTENRREHSRFRLGEIDIKQIELVCTLDLVA